MAWVTIANVRGPRGLKGDAGIGAENALQLKTTTPPGDLSGWVGVENLGLYRLWTEVQVATVSGRPAGAKPGIITVLPVNDVTNIVTWTELGPGARTWDRTTSTSSTYATPWVRRPVSKKLVGTSLTLTSATSPQVLTDFGGRLPVNLGADVEQWRVHLRNYDLSSGNSFLGELQITGLSIGEAAIDANGEYTGGWVSGTQANLNASGVTDAGAHEWVSPYFTYKLDKTKAYMLSYGFTAAVGQEVTNAQGGGFVLAGSSSIHQASPVASRSKLMPLMVWLEVEVDAPTPVIAVVGDSLSVGHSATLPVHDSWLAKLARSKGAIPVFWAASGESMVGFSDDTRWEMHQWRDMSLPDMVYFALGSNDLYYAGGVSLAVAKQRFFNSWHAIKKFAGNNMVLCSIWPRLIEEPAALIRKQYNEWLETELPGGALYYVDTAAVLTNEDGSTLNQKWSASPTDIHLKSSGYARVAAALSGNATSNIKTSGWRTAEMLNGWTGTAEVRRDANTVTLRLKNLNGSASTSTSAFQLPTGYQIRSADFLIPNGAGVMRLGFNASAQGFITQTYVQGSYQIEIRFTTENAWEV